ncbi:hypothetical protein BH09BAC4_BH09BAC4_02280 [soil metagenome]
MSRREKIDEDVKRHGWIVYTIVDDKLPIFAYTVGLYATFGHPEIIISGLRQELGHQILNNIGNDVKKGIRRQVEQHYDDILENCDCVFKQVSGNTYEEFLGQAMVYYNEQRIPFLQCVYPDRNGQFPWDTNYIVMAQELLY